jgi:hypothetical protein
MPAMGESAPTATARHSGSRRRERLDLLESRCRGAVRQTGRVADVRKHPQRCGPGMARRQAGVAGLHGFHCITTSVQ